MINYRSIAILKREIRQQIFAKKFVIMTVTMPLDSIGTVMLLKDCQVPAPSISAAS